MPPWLPHLLAPWYKAPLAGMVNDHKLPDSLPTSNVAGTKVDDLLPPPVLQTKAGRRKSARFDSLAVYWTNFKRHIGTGTAPSSSSQIGESALEDSYVRQMEISQEDGDIDEVVIDRVWSEEIKSIESHSDHGVSPEKSGESHQFNPGASDHESLVYEGIRTMWHPLTIFRWRTWPFIMEIFSSRFIDEKSEQHYAQVSQIVLISVDIHI